MWHSVLLSWTHSLYTIFWVCQVKKSTNLYRGDGMCCGTELEITTSVPKWGGKFGVENRAGDVDSPLSLNIDSQIQKSPACQKATSKVRIHLPCRYS